MIQSMSSVSGTLGMKKNGKVVGNSPMSPTRCTSSPPKNTMRPTTMIATKGEGTKVVRRGNR
ncbi:hypothetical protein D3C85_1873240 [compost metagenome]